MAIILLFVLKYFHDCLLWLCVQCLHLIFRCVLVQWFWAAWLLRLCRNLCMLRLSLQDSHSRKGCFVQGPLVSRSNKNYSYALAARVYRLLDPSKPRLHSMDFPFNQSCQWFLRKTLNQVQIKSYVVTRKWTPFCYGSLQLAKKASWRGLHFNWTRQRKNGIYLWYPTTEEFFAINFN